MKKNRIEEFLEHLRTVPNISLACKKVGISRNSIHRWAQEDHVLKTRIEKACRLGIESVSDLAESVIIQKIQQGDMRASQYWLDNHRISYIKPRIQKAINQILGKYVKEDDIVDKIIKAADIKPDNINPEQPDGSLTQDPDIII